jgi:hypothetical protein
MSEQQRDELWPTLAHGPHQRRVSHLRLDRVDLRTGLEQRANRVGIV